MCPIALSQNSFPNASHFHCSHTLQLFHFHSICGPFAVLMAYLSEFHSLQHRSRVMMTVGIFYSIANVLLPSLAWAIIPQAGWDFTLLDGKLGESPREF